MRRLFAIAHVTRDVKSDACTVSSLMLLVHMEAQGVTQRGTQRVTQTA